MATTSYWNDSSGLQHFTPVTKNLHVDTLIIGGGIMGVTTAYLLRKSGKKVALVEREKIASMDTGHTTAHLTYVTDTMLADLAKTFGEQDAKAIWKAGEVGINQIQKIIDESQIHCDFASIPGYLHLCPHYESSERDRLEENAKLAAKLGFSAQLVESTPHFRTPGIQFENQARFHPVKYLSGMLRTLEGEGCIIFEESEAHEFSEDPLSVRVGEHRIEAENIVIATHNPLAGNSTMLGASLFQTKIFLYTSYAVGAAVPKGLIEDSLYWDTRNPYGYLRVQPGEENDYIVYGGKDHKTGQVDDTSEVFEKLERELLEIVPEATIARRWSGQVIETADGAPYIGETAAHQFAATGFSGNGMTFGTLAATMARDYVLGLKNPWGELFSPSRKKIGGVFAYLKENIDYPYYLLKDRLHPEEEGDLSSVPNGEGRVLKVEGKRVAAYRSPAGDLLRLSPNCTHLGCVIHWNEAEKSWDCPCHGSRFHPTGEVMSGPAESALPKVEDH